MTRQEWTDDDFANFAETIAAGAELGDLVKRHDLNDQRGTWMAVESMTEHKAKVLLGVAIGVMHRAFRH